MMKLMKIKKYIKNGFVIALIATSIFAIMPTQSVFAADSSSCSASTTSTSGGASTDKGGSSSTSALFPAWYDGLLCGDGKTVKSPNDMGGKDTSDNLSKWVTTIALNIVSMLLYVVGYASLIFIIFGGFKYLTQGDSSSGTVAARKTIQNAIIGLVLSIMSVAIIKFVTSSIK